MKRKALISLCLGSVALVALVAFDALGVHVAEDTRGLLLALAGAVAGASAGALAPQVK